MVEKSAIKQWVIIVLLGCAQLASPSAFGWQSVTEYSSLLTALDEINKITHVDNEKALNDLLALEPQLDRAPVIEQLEYYHVLAETYTLKGEHRQAQLVAEKALAMATNLISPPIVIAKLSYNLGYSMESLGDLDLALEQYLSGLEIAESLESQKEVAIGLTNIGAIYYQTNRMQEALVSLNDALAIADNLSDEELKGLVNSELGILYGSLRETEKAIKYYEASYQHYMNAGKKLTAVNNLRNSAISYWVLGNKEKAIATYNTLLKELAPLDNTEMQFSAHIGLAQIYASDESKQYELALSHLKETEQLVAKVEHHYLPMLFLIEKSAILKQMKHYDQALETIAEALDAFHQQRYKLVPLNEARLLVQRAEIFIDMKRFKEAYDTYLRIYDLNMQYFQSLQTEAVADLRLQYESSRADIEKDILESKNKLESLSLEQAKKDAENKQFYLYGIALVTVLFAALLNSLLKNQKQLLKVSRTDGLTGVSNRLCFIERSEDLLTHARHSKQDAALLVIDCDFFKNINDTYGHSMGDEVLKLIARLGKAMFNAPSCFARFGGEEFTVIIPDCDLPSALSKAEAFRKAVEAQSWNQEYQALLSVSIGVVTANSINSHDFEVLFKHADELLYQAKSKGRNQVCA
ncbi:diguanylate cyclase [Thalassotalea euphylliae]|uniref:diguanylate cyclase n=1 Tax=Thalassotalea euphylliae TaxID=1655234 RepID=UPI00364167A6